MPVSNLVYSPISNEYFGHGTDMWSAVALPKVDAAANAVAGGSHTEVFSSFLESRPVSVLAPGTSFKEIFVKFMPRDPVPESTEMPCEDDMAICNRECEKLYSEQEAEMEEPCKLAVAQEFGGRGLCFPGTALVEERRRGIIHVGDVRIGDELAAAGGVASRVVALLHSKANTTEVYMQIHYRRTDGSTGSLTVSPAHLVLVRQGLVTQTASTEGAEGSAIQQWDWIPAQNVRPASEVEDENGLAATVETVNRTCNLGAFAPLTVSGNLLVDGVLCSCYAPPMDWELPHSACHAAMLPLRLLDSTRMTVENWTRVKGVKDPLLTVDALWLLPSMQDPSLHPWASGLLRTAILARTVAQNCKTLFPAVQATPAGSDSKLR